MKVIEKYEVKNISQRAGDQFVVIRISDRIG